MSYASERLAQIESESVKPSPVVPVQPIASKRRYCLRITGGGMDTQLTVDHPDDMEIVDAIIRKLRKAVGQ